MTQLLKVQSFKRDVNFNQKKVDESTSDELLNRFTGAAPPPATIGLPTDTVNPLSWTDADQQAKQPTKVSLGPRKSWHMESNAFQTKRG